MKTGNTSSFHYFEEYISTDQLCGVEQGELPDGRPPLLGIWLFPPAHELASFAGAVSPSSFRQWCRCSDTLRHEVVTSRGIHRLSRPGIHSLQRAQPIKFLSKSRIYSEMFFVSKMIPELLRVAIEVHVSVTEL